MHSREDTHKLAILAEVNGEQMRDSQQQSRSKMDLQTMATLDVGGQRVNSMQSFPWLDQKSMHKVEGLLIDQLMSSSCYKSYKNI